jgi:hypothetical protein
VTSIPTVNPRSILLLLGVVSHRALVKTDRRSSSSSHTGELSCGAVSECTKVIVPTSGSCFFPQAERGEQPLAQKWNSVGYGGISQSHEHCTSKYRYRSTTLMQRFLARSMAESIMRQRSQRCTEEARHQVVLGD